jgi:hypothetical protein
VVGHLKRSVEIPDAVVSKNVINWIVIEQIFTRSTYVPPPAPEEPVISSTANEYICGGSSSYGRKISFLA